MKFIRIITLGLLAIGGSASVQAMQFKALVFADASDRWHGSTVPAAREAFEQLARKHAFQLTWVESADDFARQQFAGFDAIVFVSAHPCGLDDGKRAELVAYAAAGGGIVGVHFSFAPAAAERQWPWWEDLIGTVFTSHPPQQSGVMSVHDPDFPACLHLPAKWLWTDEWYSFRMPFSREVSLLLTVDEASYHPRPEDVMGDPHPIAWRHTAHGARVFYTALGHIPEAYRDPDFLQHIFGGLLWAAGERRPEW